MTRNLNIPLFVLVSIGSIALTSLAVFGPRAQADQYEWDPSTGYHEEEWYDPSDWADPDDGLDYESDYFGDYSTFSDEEYYDDEYYDDDYYQGDAEVYFESDYIDDEGAGVEDDNWDNDNYWQGHHFYSEDWYDDAPDFDSWYEAR